MPQSRRSLRSAAAAASAGLLLFTALVQPAHAQCGDQVQVQEGETLSGIASRCAVTEARLLDLNPSVEGSKDLRPGMTLRLAAAKTGSTSAEMRDAAESLLGRLRSYAREAGRSLEGAAETVTSSVEDFVKRNPDLHQRVRKLGSRLNIPGMDKVEAQVSLSVRKGAPGTPVTLSAIGLPPNQPVDIGGGAPDGDYRILQSARTSADGTLQVTVTVPDNADARRDFIFVVANPELNLAARSARFEVAQTTGASPSDRQK